MTAATLVPCPFCGGAPFLDNLSASGTARDSYYVRCTICEIQQIVNNGSKAAAIALWNRRAAPPDEATFRARVEAIIREQSDPAWAARLIWEYVSGAKA